MELRRVIHGIGKESCWLPARDEPNTLTVREYKTYIHTPVSVFHSLLHSCQFCGFSPFVKSLFLESYILTAPFQVHFALHRTGIPEQGHVCWLLIWPSCFMKLLWPQRVQEMRFWTHGSMVSVHFSHRLTLVSFMLWLFKRVSLTPPCLDATCHCFSSF